MQADRLDGLARRSRGREARGHGDAGRERLARRARRELAPVAQVGGNRLRRAGTRSVGRDASGSGERDRADRDPAHDGGPAAPWLEAPWLEAPWSEAPWSEALYVADLNLHLTKAQPPGQLIRPPRAAA